MEFCELTSEVSPSGAGFPGDCLSCVRVPAGCVARCISGEWFVVFVCGGPHVCGRHVRVDTVILVCGGPHVCETCVDRDGCGCVWGFHTCVRDMYECSDTVILVCGGGPTCVIHECSDGYTRVLGSTRVCETYASAQIRLYSCVGGPHVCVRRVCRQGRRTQFVSVSPSPPPPSYATRDSRTRPRGGIEPPLGSTLGR